MASWITQLLVALATVPLAQGLVAALSTFILEDPTTVGCGILVSQDKMAFATALIGLASGIAIGDVGLFGLGRLAGPRLAGRGALFQERLDRAESWLNRNLVLAVVLARFVPGMRLPTYVGAGLLKAPVGRFVTVVVGASVVWTYLLLSLTVKIGEAVLPLVGRFRWPVAGLALVLLVVLQRGVAHRIGRASRGPAGNPPRSENREEARDVPSEVRRRSPATSRTSDGADRVSIAICSRGGVFGRASSPQRVVSFFELWPPWLFYAPVALYWLWLGLRFRGLLLPTVANPSIYSGGLIGESKSAILNLVASHHRRWVAPFVTFERPGEDCDLEDAVAAATEAMAAQGLDYPVVAKPDVGQRGDGVRPIRCDEELADYLADCPAGLRLVLQELVEAPAGRLACTAHQLPAAAGDSPRAAAFSHPGVLDELSSTPGHPSGLKQHRAQHLTALATKPVRSPGYALSKSLVAMAARLRWIGVWER